MKQTNSPLVSFTKLSPNHSGQRTHKIDTITPHCIVGHLSLQKLGEIFSNTARQSSSNYGIDDKGKIGLYVEEKNRSWCSSSNSNDQRAVTIEIASDLKSPYKITDSALQGLIDLSADICKRNEIPKLLWKADKKLIGKVDQQNITVHRWFANKDCPGDYIFGQLGEVAEEVNKILVAKKEILTSPKGMQPYTVKIQPNSLYYHKKPGINQPVVGVVQKNQVYTIVEEALGLGSSKWGKLKSGAGWLPLDQCVRVR